MSKVLDKTASQEEAKRQADAEQIDRRRALAAVARFSAVVAPATMVLLDAKAAKANQPCSTHSNPKPGINCY